MKLSFSLSSKPKKQPPSSSSSQPFSGDDSVNTRPPEKHYVVEFDPSKAPVGSTKSTPKISPIPNEWRPTKRMKNIDSASADCGAGDQPLQFEVDDGSTEQPSSNSISYGLNLRQSENPNPDNPNPNSMIDISLHRFKEDMMRLPDHNGVDEYADMPVEEFAAALLRGYGWVEGRGIGRNAKEDVKVKEYTKWSAKEGIGFTPELPKKPDSSSNKGDEGVRGDRSDGEKKEKEKGLYVGKEVRVVRGKEIGMKGKVLEVKKGGDLVILKVGKRGDEVRVEGRDVADLGSAEEEKCLKKLKELKIREKSSGDDGVSKHSREEVMTDRKKESRRSRDDGRSEKVVPWLASHIRVRIISRDLKGGRLYLKKGEIVDVVGPMSCDICMDESKELIQAVDQDLLETALPKRGGPVLVLYGRYKGVYGHLVERDSEKETGVVRDGDTKALLNVRLEQIAEYMGDPSYIGY